MSVSIDRMQSQDAASQHARFGVSNFTYPARNAAFLSLVGKNLSRQPESVALLGSGPIEPFEVLDTPCFKNVRVFAFDSNPEVVRIVREATHIGILNVAQLRSICRSPDSDNPYFCDKTRMQSQLQKAEIQGCRIFLKEDFEKGVYYVGRNCHKRLKIRLCDLSTKEIPQEISFASLVFEGFMLINWEKTPSLFSLGEAFLEQLFLVMRPDAWFASTTSVSHYLGEFSKPLMRQVFDVGRIPAAGVLARWSVDEKGHITSQFGTVFQSPKLTDQGLFRLGADLESHSTRAMTAFNVHVWSEEMSLESLMETMEHGNVLSFKRITNKLFQVNQISWTELSKQCVNLKKTYELEFRSEVYKRCDLGTVTD